MLRHIDCNQSDISEYSSTDEEDEALADGSSDEESPSTEPEDEVPAQTPTTGLKATYAKKRYTWKKTSFEKSKRCFENDFPLPPCEPLTAKQLFDLFVSRTMLSHVVEETNKYYVQKNGTTLGLTIEELTSVLGMFFRMGLVDMHRVRAYWEQGSRYELVAQVMSRNRFEKITSHLHFVDNDSATEQTMQDKCWKVRPWLSELRENMLKIPQENKTCIDEILIPFRGRSPIRQYLPNKPKCKWGLKVWARAGESGLCYDFDVYPASSKGFYGDQSGYELGLGSGVVIQLCSSLPGHDHNLVVADNFFSSPHLVTELTRRKISYIGTVRENRLQSCKLMSEKEMKKEGRGTLDCCVASCGEQDMVVVKWFDNRPVTLISNCVGVEPTTTVKRWDKRQKTHIPVECPAVVPEYNMSMGGVDLLDKMCYSYRFPMRAKRWYMYIFWHTVKIAAVNGWFLHKRHAQQQGNGTMPLRSFLSELATGLVLYRKRPPGRPSQENLPLVRKVLTEIPRDVRKDGAEHWPLWNERRNRCKVCPGGYTFISCSKCQTYLCLNKDRNCFTDFRRA